MESINEKLEELYGKHVILGKPNFRVVWAPSCIENRETELTDGGLWVSGLRQIRPMPKYPWLGDQWIVERVHVNYHKDVHDGPFIYECLWAFPEGLPLNWDAVNLVCKLALKMVPKDSVTVLPRTEKEALERDAAKKEIEKQEIRDAIDTTPLETSLHDGSAESYIGKDYRPSKLNGENNEQINGS